MAIFKVEVCLFFAVIATFIGKGCLSSSGSDPALQTCGTTNFYCPVDGGCKPRTQRCTGSNICIDPATSEEPECYESIVGRYTVFLGHAHLPSSRWFSKRTLFEHRFITFRGFTYEYGRTYDAQELDVADPKYKYKDGKDLNRNGIETVGSSYCQRSDALMLSQKWLADDYRLITKNCQRFAKALQALLLNGPCNHSPSRGKREDNSAELVQYIDGLLHNCSVVCCSFALPSFTVNTVAVILGTAFTAIFIL